MKLNEAFSIGALFESFGDLKRIIGEEHNKIFSGRAFTPRTSPDTLNVANYDVAEDIISLYSEIAVEANRLTSIASTKEIPSYRDILTSKGLAAYVMYLIRHPVSQNDPKLKDTGYWIRTVREPTPTPSGGSFVEFLDLIAEVSNNVVKFESDPNRKKPQITTIKKTSDFEVYRLDNYAAARKVCNTFRTNFCIGADPSMFDLYGSDTQRDTYAITLPNRTVVIVHYSRGEGFLITSHDNNSDISSDNIFKGRGKGLSGIIDDFKKAGLTLDDMELALTSIMSRNEVERVMQVARTGAPSDTIQTPDFDPLDDFDDDDLLNMFLNPPQRRI